jgi:hypothetical protein
MATHQLAQGLASLGRHGDSMLMHVSPSEVAGLKAIGSMTGHKLHTNPHTGMPEAFDFGDFFTSLLPTAAGLLIGGPAGAAMGLKAGTTAATLAPIAAGVATGAAVAGAKGDDPLMGGLMGGLGGYGGGNLASTFGKMGSAAAPASSNIALSQAGPMGIPTSALNSGITNMGLGTTSTAVPAQGVQLATNTMNLNPLLSDQFATSLAPELSTALAAGQPASTVASGAGGLDSIYSGMKTLASDPFGAGYKAFTDAGGSAFDLASPLAMAGYEGAKEDLYPKPDNSLEEKRKAEENKYRDRKTGLLNLSQASPDLRLAASGGLMSAYATGGTVNTNSSNIASGGIQDLYGTNDQTTGTQNLSKDGYGIGRLNTLAAEGSRAKAADTFYAMGGPIAFAKGGHQGYLNGDGDGMSDSIPATIEGKQPARLADGEFVIPADVVSHIGNGSSKAGSKQLYAMLDRIRKARTGHTKQGKEIKPQKYMPA